MKEEVQKKGNWLGKVGVVLLAAILIGNSLMLWQMRSVVDRVDKYNQGVVDEIGGVRGDVKVFADDLNEIRRFLLLPEKEYSVEGEQTLGKNDALSPEMENNMALFAMLDSISKEKKIGENLGVAQKTFDDLMKDQVFLNTLSSAKLAVGERGQLQVKFNNAASKNLDGSPNPLFGQPFFNLVFDGERNLFKLQSVLGDKELTVGENSSLEAEIIEYMLKNSGAVQEKKLDLARQEELDKQKLVDVAAQELQNKKMTLDSLIQDKAFQETLAADGWQIAQPAREEANKYIWDVKDARGNLVFSLAMELSSGMIKVVKDGQEIDIKSFLDVDGSKKKL